MVRPQRLPWLFWLGAAGYVALTILVATHAIDGLDRAVFRFTVRHHDPTLAAAGRHLTDFFSPGDDAGCLAVGAAFLSWRRRRPRDFLVAALSASTMAVIVLGTKAALGRSLPYSRPGAHADAFPSGHTATFLVCFGTLVLLVATRDPDLRPPLLAFVGLGTLLVAASLVYDAFHWLTDTVASAGLGVSLLSVVANAVGAGSRSRTPPHR